MARTMTMTRAVFLRKVRKHKPKNVMQCRILFGVSAPTIYAWMRKFDLQPDKILQKPRHTAESMRKRAERAFRLYSGKTRIEDVAQQMEVKAPMVRYYLRHYIQHLWSTSFSLPPPRTFAQIKVAKIVLRSRQQNGRRPRIENIVKRTRVPIEKVQEYLTLAGVG